MQIEAANNLEKYDTAQKDVRLWLTEVANFLADESTEWPVLIHCRSGRDRTGVVVALAFLHKSCSPLRCTAASSTGCDAAQGPWRV